MEPTSACGFCTVGVKGRETRIAVGPTNHLRISTKQQLFVSTDFLEFTAANNTFESRSGSAGHGSLQNLCPLRSNVSLGKVVSIMCCHVEFQNETVLRTHGCFEVAKNRRHTKQIHKPQSYRTRSFQTIWAKSSKGYRLLH